MQGTPPLQAVSHVPQWPTSLLRSAQVPLQSVWPLAQPQVPVSQI
jgi:hypothetical protein